MKEREEMLGLEDGEEREREAKIAVEEVPSRDAMCRSWSGVCVRVFWV